MAPRAKKKPFTEKQLRKTAIMASDLLTDLAYDPFRWVNEAHKLEDQLNDTWSDENGEREKALRAIAKFLNAHVIGWNAIFSKKFLKEAQAVVDIAKRL